VRGEAAQRAEEAPDRGAFQRRSRVGGALAGPPAPPPLSSLPRSSGPRTGGPALLRLDDLRRLREKRGGGAAQRADRDTGAPRELSLTARGRRKAGAFPGSPARLSAGRVPARRSSPHPAPGSRSTRAMVARVGLLLRALLLLLWGGLDAEPAERGDQELRKEAEVRGVCLADRGPRVQVPPECGSRATRQSHPSGQVAVRSPLSVLRPFHTCTQRVPVPGLGPHRRAEPHLLIDGGGDNDKTGQMGKTGEGPPPTHTSSPMLGKLVVHSSYAPRQVRWRGYCGLTGPDWLLGLRYPAQGQAI
jgi:hypothetical protein